MAVLIKVDGTKEQLTPKDDGTVSLELLQSSIGGWIEQIKVPFTQNSVLIVDEEGRLKNKQLNQNASVLVRKPIVGDAVLCCCKGDDLI